MITLVIPSRPMDIYINVPAAKIASKSIQNVRFHLRYTDKWEAFRLAP
jgi:hypothetical protein